MNTSNLCTPLKEPDVVTQSLDLYLYNKRRTQYLIWGSVNAVLLSIVLFDLSNKCPYDFSPYWYVEYFASFLLILSLLFYLGKFFYYHFFLDPIKVTEAQRRLLASDDADTSFVVTPPAAKSPQDLQSTPINISALSWQSSFNESANKTLASSSWFFNKGSPNQSFVHQQQQRQNVSMNSSSLNNTTQNNSNPASFTSPYMKLGGNEIIMDQDSLKQYLKEVHDQEEKSFVSAVENQSTMQTSGLTSFWNYGVGLLKTSVYQLSPTVLSSKQASKDDSGIYGGSEFSASSEELRKISSAKLSTYVANLRMWISCTILQRLVHEINQIDAALKSRGFSEIQIGAVGLERLKKTAENQQLVNLHVPMLPLVIPFLEMSTNQEYLVQRIRDLSKGSCIADYHWNAGSSYNGLNWDEHLPTDSAIIFHLFCTYLDSQLRPLPQPGGRPFYNRYVIIGDAKRSQKELLEDVKNKTKCAILCTNPQKPKFNFISVNKIHSCAHDRNNLFYVLIQFLLYMKSHQEGLIEGVSLGKNGINLLCVIED